MKKILLTTLITAGGIFPALCATVTDASVLHSVSFSLKCDDTACTGPVKGKLALAETATISAIEEAELQSDTSITLTSEGFIGVPVELNLSEDPNFQNGDTSAKIQKTIAVEDNVELIITAQLKWGNGEFSAKVNGKLVGELSSGIMLEKKGKDVPQATFTVEVVRGVTPVFTTAVELVGDVKTLELIQFKSTGEGSEKIVQSFKSRAIVPGP